MKVSCDVVKDLLPLYCDDVCSAESKKIVEEHLAECGECASILQKMANNTFENRLRQESREVVGHFNQTVKRKSLIMGMCLSGVMAIPVLVCLIVNLVTGHALNWFFIVLTSLMVAASLTVIPLVVESKKYSWTVSSFTGSLLLLLLTCCLYTRGDWFFIAAIPVLFGLSVVFLPGALYQMPQKGLLRNHKGLIAMTADTVLLYGIIIVTGLYDKPADYWNIVPLANTIVLVFPWTLFLLIRYVGANGLIRAGLSVMAGGIMLSLLNDVTNWIMDGIITRPALLTANLYQWNSDAAINANIYLLSLLTGLIVGGALLAAGFIRRRKKAVPSTP